MRGKVVLGVLAMTGILALSAAVAQAGGGGVPSTLTSFFVCHAISGANVGKVVDVYSDEVGTPNTRTNITIGQSILACAQALLWPAGATPIAGTDISPKIPDGIGGFKQPFELKCYSAQGPGKKTGQATLYNAEDALFGPEFGIQGSPDVRLICGPSQFSQ